jgi:enterochelin esterase-like enzyme
MRTPAQRKISILLGLLGGMLTAAIPSLSSVQTQTKTGEISIGSRFVFTSKSLAGEIPVRIHLPPDYTNGDSKYPVLYMLEIADDFVFASATADFLAGCGRIPGLIVVSVDVDKLSGPPPAIIAFLDKDLFPYVEHNYRTAPRRVLYGHSGRSFAALFMMLNRPELFDGYICPGLGLSWPVEKGRMDFSGLAGERLSKLTTFPKALVFSLGDEKNFFAGVNHFLEVLKAKAPKDFRWTYLRMPGDDHDSTKLKTLYQGLEFIFGPAGTFGGSR